MYYLHPRSPGSTPKFKPQQQQKSHTHKRTLSQEHVSESQTMTENKESGETCTCAFFLAHSAHGLGLINSDPQFHSSVYQINIPSSSL